MITDGTGIPLAATLTGGEPARRHPTDAVDPRDPARAGRRFYSDRAYDRDKSTFALPHWFRRLKTHSFC
ncbi:hypothetical protein HDA45_007100 [Amycolatopsis umgeniensis]|uniref:Uncharacterized protein n=1 Tax=Amycolatopsis umgeniensis TaxID=336628 RepID=A0A841BE16_9PSEU|nr:hypothetical protein [Amycolatopsis umgeniensis]